MKKFSLLFFVLSLLTASISHANPEYVVCSDDGYRVRIQPWAVNYGSVNYGNDDYPTDEFGTKDYMLRINDITVERRTHEDLDRTSAQEFVAKFKSRLRGDEIDSGFRMFGSDRNTHEFASIALAFTKNGRILGRFYGKQGEVWLDSANCRK